MNTDTVAVNRMLRRHVSSNLNDAGFTMSDARNGRAWQNAVIDVFNIRSVGAYFSSVTGWPSGSLSVSLGVFWTFVGDNHDRIKRDAAHRLHPAEHECHQRLILRRDAADPRASKLANRVEQKRDDIWWVDADGSNAELVALSIADAVRRRAIPWYENNHDLRASFQSIERERDCLQKFEKLMHLAKHLSLVSEEEHYTKLYDRERSRIGSRFA